MLLCLYENPESLRVFLKLENVSHNNLEGLNVSFPLGVFTSVTGVSGSGKSTLVSKVLVELVVAGLGKEIEIAPEEDAHSLERSEKKGFSFD